MSPRIGVEGAMTVSQLRDREEGRKGNNHAGIVSYPNGQTFCCYFG